MACFIVPAVEAVVATAIEKTIDNENKEVNKISEISLKTEFAQRLNWLKNLLWGGSSLLAFEHLWHGEIVPWFPFLTAAQNTADTLEMLEEMATVGTSMAILVTLVWCGMVITSHKISVSQTKLTKKKVQ